jgi:hypothetical protein
MSGHKRGRDGDPKFHAPGELLCEGNQSNLTLLPNIQGHIKEGKVMGACLKCFPEYPEFNTGAFVAPGPWKQGDQEQRK